MFTPTKMLLCVALLIACSLSFLGVYDRYLSQKKYDRIDQVPLLKNCWLNALSGHVVALTVDTSYYRTTYVRGIAGQVNFVASLTANGLQVEPAKALSASDTINQELSGVPETFKHGASFGPDDLFIYGRTKMCHLPVKGAYSISSGIFVLVCKE